MVFKGSSPEAIAAVSEPPVSGPWQEAAEIRRPEFGAEPRAGQSEVNQHSGDERPFFKRGGDES